jgi:hypothetical protein
MIDCAAEFHANGELSAGGLFLYETGERDGGPPARPRCWRPDLVAAILAWIEGIPAIDLKLFIGFQTGSRGEFVMRFLVPAKDATSHEVTVEFDHNYFCAEAGSRQAVSSHILPFDFRLIYGMANLAATEN